MAALMCVDCGSTQNLAEQFDARRNRIVWLCAYCHYQAVSGGA
ncbi:hypothetical protein [Nonomuraea basaltis]|nr:hypothetical protein [Nonomuraea basaltis]